MRGGTTSRKTARRRSSAVANRRRIANRPTRRTRVGRIPNPCYVDAMHLVLLVLLTITAASAAGDEEKRTDALFERFTKASPGCAVGAMRDGKILFSRGYGVADLEHNVAISPASVFYLASVSKQFLAFAVLLLEQQGKLSRADLIGKHLPGLPPHTARVTLQQLLHHTGGVRDYLTLGMMAGFSPDHVWTERAALEWISRQQALNFEPGTEHLYSNSGYVLLSLAAQRVTGGRLQEWMKANVYGPLGMNSSRWQHDHRDPVERRAHGYNLGPGGQGWKISDSLLDTIGDGGMYSSVEDLLRWAANFDTRKLGAQLLDAMAKPGLLAGNVAIANGYGMGLAKGSYRGLETIVHGGGLGGYRTMFFRVPSRSFTVICLCNNGTANPGEFAQRTADIWLDGQFPRPVPEAPKPTQIAKQPEMMVVSSEIRQAITGRWWSDELAAVYRFYDDNGKFTLAIGDAEPIEVGGAAGGLLRARGLELTPVRSGDRVTGIMLGAGRVRGILLRRLFQ